MQESILLACNTKVTPRSWWELGLRALLFAFVVRVLHAVLVQGNPLVKSFSFSKEIGWDNINASSAHCQSHQLFYCGSV